MTKKNPAELAKADGFGCGVVAAIVGFGCVVVLSLAFAARFGWELAGALLR